MLKTSSFLPYAQRPGEKCGLNHNPLDFVQRDLVGGAVMPEARKVWQLAATPSSAWRTLRLTIRKTSTRLMRLGMKVPSLVIDRHSGVPISFQMPAT